MNDSGASIRIGIVNLLCYKHNKEFQQLVVPQYPIIPASPFPPNQFPGALAIQDSRIAFARRSLGRRGESRVESSHGRCLSAPLGGI